MSSKRCRPLRRTVRAVLLGNLFGLLLLVVATALVWAAVIERERGYVVGAGCCIVGWAATLSPPVRLCEQALVSRSLFARSRRHLISEIARVEVGLLREGYGYSGYSGYVMAIQSKSGSRTTLEQSRYCGRRRLERWGSLIAEHDSFVGEVSATSCEIGSSRS